MVKICLNMIVKNEQNTIERLLNSVRTIIDYWVICDTGSTDRTKDIIIEFFKKHQINGELIDTKWKNFGYNRTEAYQYAKKAFQYEKNKSNYILFLDADMVIENKNFNKESLTKDIYYLIQSNNILEYQNVRLINTLIECKIIGSTHEYYDYDQNCSQELLTTLKINDIGDGGSKEDKFERDIKLLKEDLEKNPNDTRTLFYLANSYRDSLQYDLAIETYLKKIQIGGWDEETWNSYYTIGNIYYTQDNSKCIDYYLQAYNYRPSRAEPIYQIVKYYREKKNYKLCYLFDKIGSQIKKPTDRLFIENNVYDYKFDYEKTIYYYYLDLQTEGDQLCDHLIYNKNISNQNQQEYYNIVSNSIFYVKNISDYISIKNITKINLNYKDLDDYQITNPSIFVFNNRQLINLRNVNFYISPENEYLIIKNQKLISYDNICDTKNFLYEINKNTELTKLIEIKNNNLEFKKHKTLIDGIEDIRLIELNNKIYFIGTCRFVSEDNKNKMVLGTLNNNYETESLIELKYKDTECEKNWMPFIKDNKLLLVYSLSPLTILEPDLKTGICKIYKYDSKINYSEIRGGSQGILLDDYYYFIIHNVRIHNNVRHYLHRIIKLNQNLELVSISKSFYFIELGIEFVAGLCSYNNDVKISFGKHDNEAYICTLTKEEFIKLSEISIELK